MQGCCSDDTYIYTAKINGTTEKSTAIARTHRETGATTFLTNSATGTYYFSQLAHANDLDIADVGGVTTMFVATGTSGNLSSYVHQGFEYYDGRIYVPLSEDTRMISSCIIAYDVIGVSGTVKNNPIFTAWISDATYGDLFEIESCTICPGDGRLYFNTNLRKTSSDANHDGIHYINGFVYNAAKGDAATTGNYYLYTRKDGLVSIGTYCSAQASGTGTAAALAQATAVYGYYADALFNR